MGGVMTTVLLAHPTLSTPGDQIAWTAGQQAVFLSDMIGRHNVIVVSGKFVWHEAVPGEPCLEVTFEDGHKPPGCVRASALRLRPPELSVEEEGAIVSEYQQRLVEAQKVLVARWPHRTGPLLTSKLEKIIASMMVDYAIVSERRRR